MAEFSKARNIRDPLLTRGTRGFARLWQMGDRAGPDSLTDVSEAVRERVATFADYAPKTLEKVLTSLRSLTRGAPPP
jgi:hypothetical protein